jgi:hypothetical protein
MKKIRVYTENHAPIFFWLNHLVHPVRAFWGDGTEDWPKWEKDFLFYKNYFEITFDIKESDIGFLPLTLNYYIKNNLLSEVDALAKILEKNNKKLIVWIDGDHPVRYRNSNCIFIPYFGQKSEKKQNEFIQPGDMKKDILNEFFQGELQVRDKSDKPIIGFDGIANYPPLNLAGTILKNSIHKLFHSILKTQFSPDPVIPYLIKRKEILKKLSDQSEIITNFTIRDSFAPGTIGKNKNARIEYVNNIINSDYTLCYRGAANYSLRLYETLCLGRIPLFIDTDCVLPFENEIPWKDICLWVEESEMDHLGEKVTDYHHSMNGTQFREKQVQCRQIWEQYCTKEGFINHFHQFLNQQYSFQGMGASA